jgi:hypothetical protein
MCSCQTDPRLKDESVKTAIFITKHLLKFALAAAALVALMFLAP